MKTQSHHSEKGFTLIELLVVVAIVGLLGSIAISSYSEYRNKAYLATQEFALRAGITDMEAYISNGDYVKDISGVRRVNANGTVFNNANADSMLPTARPSANTYIWVRAYTGCTGEGEDRYIVQSFHWLSNQRLRYDQYCGGNTDTRSWAKNPGEWS